MSCIDIRSDLSPFIDGELKARRLAEIRRHLDGCAECRAELDQIAGVRSLLSEAARVAPPPDLALAIRVRVSASESRLGLLDRLWIRVQNMFEPIAVPALAGVLSSLVLFGIFVHTFTLPAITNDIPLYTLNTPPRIRVMAPLGVNTGDQGIVIQVQVDQEGRISDFRVLNASPDPATMSKLRNALLFSRFNPATTFGIPRASSTVVNYASISVRG